jgi:signal transduction histidine kinase
MTPLESILLRAESQGRVDERERIARELHDTLLQGAHGLVLRIQSVADQLPRGDTRRTALETALDSAEELIQAARERVSNLRTAHFVSDLPVALDRAAKLLAIGSSAQYRLVVSGTPFALPHSAAIQIYSIVREALANAFEHAHAQLIHTDVDYQRDQVVFSIRDNGRGFKFQRVGPQFHAKHFGLQGMHERAHALGAQLEVRSVEGQGTCIRLSLPSTPGHRDETAIHCAA